MSDQFDAYHKWLGIPPEDQPPHHYRLLGINLFESDPDVIESAADGRMAHLRSYQSGKNAVQSQKLLNEVSAARVTLLDVKKRAAYDAALRQQQAAKQPLPTAEPVSVSPAVPVAAPGAAPSAPLVGPRASSNLASAGPPSQSAVIASESPRRRGRKKAPSWNSPVILGAGVAALAMFALLAFLFKAGGDEGGTRTEVNRSELPTAVPPAASRSAKDRSAKAEAKPRPKPGAKTMPKPRPKPEAKAKFRSVECAAKSVIIHEGFEQHRVPVAELPNNPKFMAVLQHVAEGRDAMVFLIRSDGVQTYRKVSSIAGSNNVFYGKLPVVGRGRIELAELEIPDPRPAPEGASAVLFLCFDNRVYPIAAEDWRKTIRKKAEYVVKRWRLDRGPAVGVDKERFFEEFEDLNRTIRDDFFTIELYASGIYPRLRFIPRENSGSTIKEVLNPRSRFHRMLTVLDKTKYYARFIVLPDSFEVYLAARAVADEKGLPAGWDLQSENWQYTCGLGGPIQFGPKPPNPNPPPPPSRPQNVID